MQAVSSLPPQTAPTKQEWQTLFDSDEFLSTDSLEAFESIVQVRGGVKTELHLEQGVKLNVGDTIKLTVLATVQSAELGSANKDGTIVRETIFVKPQLTKAALAHAREAYPVDAE